MKKLKFLPSVLMLVLSVAVLAMGVYAANSGQNTIAGTITVNAAGAPVTITAYAGNSTSGTRLGSMTTRAGDTLNIGEIVIDQNNDVLENNSKDIFLTFSTTSDKLLVLDAPSMLIFDAENTNDQKVDAVLKSVQTVTYTTTASESSNGLKYFTSGSDCSMLCHLSLTRFFGEELTLTFNLDIDVLDATDASAYSVDGTTYTFGSFPQSKVDASSLTLTDTGLNFMAYNDTQWEDLYEYYDIFKDSNGNKYIKTTTYYDWDNFSEAEGVRYYKFEPLTWTKLATKDGEGELLLCNTAVENVKYRKNYLETEYNGKTDCYATDVNKNVLTDGEGNAIYANNYAESDPRAYMNHAFYNGAFSVLESQLIATTTVDNSLTSTGDSTNQYVCGNTEDKIFALSITEASYGAGKYFASEESRIIDPSDYSNGKGLHNEDDSAGCIWLLRSPGPAEYKGGCRMEVLMYGGIESSRVDGESGCVPALILGV